MQFLIDSRNACTHEGKEKDKKDTLRSLVKLLLPSISCCWSERDGILERADDTQIEDMLLTTAKNQNKNYFITMEKRSELRKDTYELLSEKLISHLGKSIVYQKGLE